MRMRTDHAKLGFTLVELLVASALTALLIVAVQTLVVRSHRCGQELEKRRAARGQMARVEELLRQDVRSLANLGAIELDGRALRLRSLCDLEFSTPSSRHCVDVQYQVASDGTLTRAQRGVGEDKPWPVGAVLMENLRSAEFSVFEGRGWVKQWPPAVARSARAIRVRLVGGAGREDEFIIPVGHMRWNQAR